MVFAHAMDVLSQCLLADPALAEALGAELEFRVGSVVGSDLVRRISLGEK